MLMSGATAPVADVSRETMDRLALFADLLLRWSKTINLIGAADLPDLWPRHIWDSLQALSIVTQHNPPILDVGSGAGFPGLVLAIASGYETHLVEADHRKSAFLREAARTVGAPARVHSTRIETLAPMRAGIVTARALAPLPQLLAWSVPHLAPDGIALFWKGERAEQELTQAKRAWHMRVQPFPSQTRPGGVILALSEISRALPES
jgi:16S rRNA (guanine527-N7)-methyltransferase